MAGEGPEQSAQCAPAVALKSKSCECRSCQYGKKVRDLIDRQTSPEDKVFLEEMYSNLFHTEDDRDYWRAKYEVTAPVKYLVMGFHFDRQKGKLKRLVGHDDCEICEYLERPL